MPKKPIPGENENELLVEKGIILQPILKRLEIVSAGMRTRKWTAGLASVADLTVPSYLCAAAGTALLGRSGDMFPTP